MSIKKIKGLSLATDFLKELALKVNAFEQDHQLNPPLLPPKLGIVLVGEHPASLSYIKSKQCFAAKACISS
jgi:5,10-methylene-tetrahydrofolate dehydrogenase/methenyl tetrahydrofolate cyclohydrolase